MKPHIRPTLPILAALMLAGCGAQDRITAPGAEPAATDEQAVVASAMSDVPDLLEDGVFETDAETGLEASLSASAETEIAAAVRPRAFARRVRSVERRFEVAFADTDSTGRPTVARVTVHKWIRGTFVVRAGTGTRDTVRRDSLVRKPFADHSLRHVMLRRVDRASGRGAWRVVAGSGVRVRSHDRAGNEHAAIVSLRVQASGLDTTVTDPLALVRLRGVMQLSAGEEVRLTVATRAADDVVVLLHPAGPLRFRNNGDGTHSGVWRAARVRAVSHVGVNALSHGTLFDSAAAYESEAWILPYVVHPEQIAERLE